MGDAARNGVKLSPWRGTDVHIEILRAGLAS